MPAAAMMCVLQPWRGPAAALEGEHLEGPSGLLGQQLRRPLGLVARTASAHALRARAGRLPGGWHHAVHWRAAQRVCSAAIIDDLVTLSC